MTVRVQDAVVIVPGIMGSVLETDDGVIWGVSPKLLPALWRGRGVGALAVTPQELEAAREGAPTSRVRATRLLDVFSHAPVLQGFEPYTRLVKRVAGIVPKEAILEFPYDWRLPVSYNAALLAEAALGHLRRCRENGSRSRELAKTRPDGRPPQLVFVAHSMGGLLVRKAFTPPLHGEELREGTRACITLGTPFRGAAKAAVMLSSGGPVPWVRGRLRDLVRTMPGVHDLLPTYPCLETPDGGARLTPSDVASFGGDADLAQESAALHAGLVGVELPGHVVLRGSHQRTPTNLRLVDGVARAGHDGFVINSDGSCRAGENGLLRDHGIKGDGTVPRFSAELQRGPSAAQQHGGLARARPVLDHVEELLLESPPLTHTLGPGDLGLEVPDVVEADQAWTITVTGLRRPLRVRVEGAADGAPRTSVPLAPADGDFVGHVAAGRLAPGLYRVRIPTGEDGVSQLVLVTEPEV